MDIQCYWKSGGLPIRNQSDWQGLDGNLGLSPCGPVNSTTKYVSCCFNGDACLENGICSFSSSGKGLSGYRVSACTDPKYEDPSCLRACNNVDPTDVQYNDVTKMWACCSNTTNGPSHCQDPSDYVFHAPGPSDLKVLFNIPRAGFSPTSQVLSATETSGSNTALSTTFNPQITSTPSSSSSSGGSTGSSSQKSSGLSTGANAGIGVGVGLAVAFFVCGLWWMLQRHRNHAPTERVGSEEQYPQDRKVVSELQATEAYVPPVELPAKH